MTPKEKAIELLDKMERQTYKYQEYAGAMYKTCEIGYEGGKKCALIAVDEIIKLDIFDCNDEWSNEDGDTRDYWREVKQEIEKL